MKTRHGKNVCVERKPKECHQWKAKRQCTKGNACSFRHDENKRGKVTQLFPPAPRAQTQNGGKSSLKGNTLRGCSPSGKRSRRPCKNFISGNCTNPLCDFRHLPECQHYQAQSGCKFGEKCVSVHKEVDSQPNKKPKKTGGKGSVTLLKNSKQLSCGFQKIKPPKSKSILQT